MNNGLPDTSHRQRPYWFLLVAVVHVLAVLCWPRREAVVTGQPSARTTTVFFVPVPQPAAPAVTTAPTPTRAVARSRPVRPAPAAATLVFVPAAPDTATPPIPVPQEPVLSSAPPQPDADEIRANALKSVGAIDKELRKASLNMAERHLSYQRPGLERAIASAHRPRGLPKIEELRMSDGRAVSRIGNMCAYKESNALTGGRDVIQNGVRTMFTTCPSNVK